MGTKSELVAVGNALVDIVAISDEDLASVLDLPVNQAIHVSCERFTELLVALPAPAMSAGGGSANTAKIASMLGIRSAFVGRVGSDWKGDRDRFADLFETQMREAGVELHLGREATQPTGGCLVVRMTGDRYCIAACPAAALALSAQDLPEELVQAAKVLVLDGYALGRTELVDRAFALADRYGTAVALDVGSADIAARFSAFIALKAADFPLILFLNEAEAAAFCGAVRPGEDYAETGDFAPLRSMTESGPFPIVVLKRGPRGAVVYASGAELEAPTPFATPLDVTGAGDSFAAGFLAGWIRDRPLTECAALGNRVAREIISVPGTRVPAGVFKRIAKSFA